ncbi:hypothetical protein [Phenylobacterium sp. SCN 70-31]|uniref:hypothetical protein n=1 Tax=Phenylobacterium sp. SCN 70-31 TaxID=1660129 RepID=UPI00086C0556|nr:hypothetical protein [Phenylobacterium sp. SCN 70-31]ODT83315.1 MAG: hypothetical protein ABS78_23210 [Phenylobacterium sp. SCN 70-31]
MSAITTVEALEACVGAAGLPVKMKIIDHLDRQARRWIAEAPLAFVGVGTPDGPRVGLAGGARGFATVTGSGTLALPRASLEGVTPPRLRAQDEGQRPNGPKPPDGERPEERPCPNWPICPPMRRRPTSSRSWNATGR